jgi:hypothetical protein
MITRNNYLEAVKYIQSKFKHKIKNRYNYLVNNNDCDPITLEPVYMIPRDNLLVFWINNKLHGCNALALLHWIAKKDFFSIPKSPFTNKCLTVKEIMSCIDKVQEYIAKDKLLGLKYNKEIYDLLNTAIETNRDRMNPQRVYDRLYSKRKNFIDELEVLTHDKEELDYICLGTLVNCTKLSNILKYPMVDLLSIQSLARKLYLVEDKLRYLVNRFTN